MIWYFSLFSCHKRNKFERNYEMGKIVITKDRCYVPRKEHKKEMKHKFKCIPFSTHHGMNPPEYKCERCGEIQRWFETEAGKGNCYGKRFRIIKTILEDNKIEVNKKVIKILSL